MTRLLIVRHGQSVANLGNIFAGHIDIELTELGLRQAQKTAAFIAENYSVDKVYASDLRRAFVTGQTVAERLGLEAIPEKGLREIAAGDWEGVHFDELPKLSPVEFAMWNDDIGKFRCPAGESSAELQSRVVSTIRRIAAENEGKTLVIASHAFAIRALISFADSGDTKTMHFIPWVSNASVTEAEVENGEIRIIKSGQDAHLEELATKAEKL
ncbi:MAG: histidine phosphatase family protein [Clostridia bacterium]|nr:histidine phosphatase family protein [Clostridia bacterium]